MDFFRVTCAQRVQQTLHSQASIYNIFHNHYRAVCQIFGNTDHFLDNSGRGHPLIRSQLHERNLAGNSNVFHQISSKHKRAVQDAEKQRIFTSQIAIDFICNAGYFFQNVLFLDRNSELFVFYLYGVRFASLMMGIWYLSTSTANKFAGTLGGLYPEDGKVKTLLGFRIETMFDFFMVFVIMSGVASLILFLLSKKLQKMMHGVE